MKKIARYGRRPFVMMMIATLVLSSVAFLELPHHAEAAAMTSVRDILSTSAPATLADHTIYFVTPTGVNTNGITVTLTFGSGFTMGTFNKLNFDLGEGNSGTCTSATYTEKTLNTSAGAGVWGVGQASQVVTFTSPTDATTGELAAGDCVRIRIGSNAVTGGAGSTQITNPSKVAAAGTADISTIDIAGSIGDTGEALVATIEGVTVSVTVSQSLSFTIAGVNVSGGGNCNSDFASTTAGPNTTATTVPFGSTASTNAFLHGCQDLTVSTNAANGYSVTAQENTNLISGSTTLPDSIGDNGLMDQSTLDTWASTNVNGFAYSCKNKTGSPCVLSAVTNYKQFACTGNNASCDPGSGGETAQNVLTNSSPANGDVGRVEYKLDISPTQPAGAYSNTITYIATPTF